MNDKYKDEERKAKIISVLETIPKEILIQCAETLFQNKIKNKKSKALVFANYCRQKKHLRCPNQKVV